MPSIRNSTRRNIAILWAILALTLALRLIHITNPPLGIHSWRQSDTAAVARNFQRSGFDLAHPQIDWAGAGPTVVEMEFPLYCAATGALALITGEVAFSGRLLAALGSVITVFYLYRLARLCCGRRVALWSAAIYSLLPLSIYYGRAIMPESWMLAASVAGVYWMAVWSYTGSRAALVWSCASVSLACLLKLPTLYLGLPILWLAHRRLGVRCLLSPALWCYGAGVILPVAAWYAHAHRVYLETGLTFGISDSDKWGRLDALLSHAWYYDVFIGKISEDHLTWAGLPVAVLGLLWPRRRRAERLFDVWTLAVVIYLFLVSVGNKAHEYYQLPLMLPLCIIMGRVIARLWRRREWAIVVVLVLMLGFSAIKYRKYLRTEERARSPEFVLGTAVERQTRPDELVIIANGVHWGDPTVLYIADRKGWALAASQLDPARLDDLRAKGASVLAGLDANMRSDRDHAWLAEVRAKYPSISDIPGVFIFRIPAK